MRKPIRSARVWGGAVLLALAAPAALHAGAEAIFSIKQNQYGQSSGAGMTLHQHRIYHSANGVSPWVDPFVPADLGLDALAVGDDGTILFSVEQRGLVPHEGGLTMVEHDRVYSYRPETGTIAPVPAWESWGIEIGSLDALDRAADGRLIFSTSSYVWVAPTNGPLTLRPQNAYAFDAAAGTIDMAFDGVAVGLGDLDGIDLLGNGRIAFSTAANVFVMTPTGGRLLHQNQVYVRNPNGEISLVVDAAARGIQSLDAFDVEALIVVLDAAGVTWSGIGSSYGYDLVRGDLASLRASEGDFALATIECLANNVTTARFDAVPAPPSGEGSWVLVRPDQGSYDSESFRQVAGRDPGIAASGHGCP
jgi:hypothetical protein